jgi:hypothetical protein
MAHCSFCEMSEEQAREEERERIIKLLDMALQWALPANSEDKEWNATQVINFAKKLINEEIEVVIAVTEGENK